MIDRVSITNEAPNPILVVGSVGLDDIITPYMKGERILGGSASYASLAASYYAPVKMVGVVGNDFNDVLVQRLERRGVDLRGLKRDLSGPTFYWKGEYQENFNHRETLDIQLNVFENFRPDLPDTYKNTDYVMLGNIEPDLQIHVLNQLNSNAFIIADTIELWIETKKNDFISLAKRVDCLVIDDSEAKLLTGEINAIEAGHKLLDIGTKMAIMTRGEYGAYLFHADGIFAMPAYPVTKLQDPTGAGDSYAGALLGYLAAAGQTDFDTLKQAMLYATVTASLTVESFSCDSLESAGSAKIKERYHELVRMMSL